MQICLCVFAQVARDTLRLKGRKIKEASVFITSPALLEDIEVCMCILCSIIVCACAMSLFCVCPYVYAVCVYVCCVCTLFVCMCVMCRVCCVIVCKCEPEFNGLFLLRIFG